MPDAAQSAQLLSQLIQKQMVILGPNVAVGIARRVPGVVVADNGQVSRIDGDPDTAVKAVVDAFVALSGNISRVLFESMLKAGT